MPKASRRPEGLFFNRFLNGVEAVGNRLPHPVTLFAVLAALMIFISALCAKLGVSATGMLVNRETNQVEEQTIYAVSLLNREGVTHILTQAVRNFTGYAPLGVVLVAMLGVGVAEGSGYIGALLKQAVRVTPKKMVTAAVVFLGVMSSLASDAGYVVLVPMGALLFAAYGRHPMAGLAAAFAGVSGGYSANLMIGSTEPMLAGIATEAAGLVDPAWVVEPTANWYFMIVSTFLLTAVGVFVNDRIITPRLGEYRGAEKASERTATEQEKKGLRNTGIFTLIYIALLLICLIPKNGLLRGEDGSILESPFINGLVPILIIYFILAGVVYGRTVGTIKKSGDVPKMMADSLQSLTGYVVLVFVIAQFINMFSYTNLGTIIAVNASNALQNVGFTGIPLVISVILITIFVNFFMTSGTAKWYIFAPIFVPMFMLLGYSPEFAQVVYRIGDSIANPLTPIYPYLPIVIGMAQKYEKKTGIGTIISMTLPYSVAFLLVWIVQTIIWIVFDLPLGPGASVFM